MLRALTTALFVLSFPLIGLGQTLTGTVADPQRAVIVGARVVLACRGHTEQRKTDPQGQFAFGPRPTFKYCRLTITYPGFAPFSQSLPENPGFLTIQLRLAERKYVVIVSSASNDLASIGRTTLGTVSLSDAELKQISNNTLDLIRYAKQLAGATSAQDSVYVDGLPSRSLPPIEMVAQITVNADPFSAEYADGDQTHIEITTKSLDRKLRFNFGGASLGAGGNNILAPGLRSASRLGNFSLTGPVPRLPLAFSLHANFGHNLNEEPIQAVLPQAENNARAGTSRKTPVTSHMGSIAFTANYSGAENLRANFFYNESRSKGSNLTVGGLTLPEAGLSSRLATRELRATLDKTATRYTYRGGLVVNREDSHLWANSRSVGVRVLGSLVAGGAATAESRMGRTGWMWKNVLVSSFLRRLWTAGLTLSRSEDFDFELPNPAGLIDFETLQSYAEALGGARTGTWFITRGRGRVHYATTGVGLFLQSELLQARNAVVRGGLRTDYQTRGGVLVSPRLSAAAQWHGFTFRGGGGVFVQDWPNDVFVQAMKRDGIRQQQLLAKNASFADVQDANPAGGRLIVSTIAADLVRSCTVMLKSSLERRLGRFVPGVEYTWTNGGHLLGSRRLATQNGWMDILESGRRLRRHQLHLRVEYGWKGQTVVGHYERIESRDDTDGPFSFPERQHDLRAEWARTSGVSPHNFTAVGSFKLPGAISLTLVASSRSSAPYNVISGRDVVQNGLYNHRADRARNSGNGPGYNSLALYAYRRVPLPSFLVGSQRKVYVDVGLQAENLLGNRNYLNFGSVIGSPLFGRPLAALPDRSFRLWFTLSQ